MASSLRQLHQLARLYGVQTAYYDVSRRRRPAAPESLLKVLSLLGAGVEKLSDVPTALRTRRHELTQRLCEPVLVTWDGKPAEVALQVPIDRPGRGSLTCHLTLESGEEKTWTCELDRLPVVQDRQDTAAQDGGALVVRKLPLPEAIPCGYHQIRLTCQERTADSLLIVAPQRAYTPSRKTWGVFVPLYALHASRSWGGGDFSDLNALVEWTAQLGGSVVATLPMLTAFLDQPYDPSPYAPASRLFWNELYLDVTRVPELESCPTAQALLASTAVQQEIAFLRSSPQVDYRRQGALKRRILEALARCFFAHPSDRQSAFQHYVASHPAVADYAGFRAVGERLQTSWPDWPQPLRDGGITEHDGDEDARRYHLYVQWLAHEQLQMLADTARQHGPGLYLDLPLGVHRCSYDVWREREAFVVEASGGAPPDTVFTKGQDWGFPPLHPEKIREQRYQYVLAYLRHHLRQAGLLRIDHVMGLHRLFWVPQGCEASQGVYVRYPAEEIYALLTLESQRHQSAIIGENLGTVPAYVNATMARHGIQRMYVIQYELPAVLDRPLRSIPSDSVASLNTHDMPPFAAFWQGLDIHDRFTLGLLDENGLQREQHNHAVIKAAFMTFLRQRGWLDEEAADLPAILNASLAYLAASPAKVVLVTLEDLWAETRPQNVPGTGTERPNWQRKTQTGFETWTHRPEVLTLLQQIQQLRRQGSR